MKQVTLCLLINQQTQQVCLAMKKRGFGQGKYNGAGGKLDGQETVEQALIRETQEELKVTPIQYEKMAEITFFGHDFSQHCHVYRCYQWDGEPQESEEMKPFWFGINQLPIDKMWDGDQEWMPRVIQGEYLTAAILFDEQYAVQKYTITPVTGFPLTPHTS